MDLPIATLRLIATPPNELPREIVVRIGTPTELSTGDWVCAGEIEGLHNTAPIHGVDSLQALSLAVRFVFQLLKKFKGEGGILRFPPSPDRDPSRDDLEFPLSAYVDLVISGQPSA